MDNETHPKRSTVLQRSQFGSSFLNVKSENKLRTLQLVFWLKKQTSIPVYIMPSIDPAMTNCLLPICFFNEGEETWCWLPENSVWRISIWNRFFHHSQIWFFATFLISGEVQQNYGEHQQKYKQLKNKIELTLKWKTYRVVTSVQVSSFANVFWFSQGTILLQ